MRCISNLGCTSVTLLMSPKEATVFKRICENTIYPAIAVIQLDEIKLAHKLNNFIKMEVHYPMVKPRVKDI